MKPKMIFGNSSTYMHAVYGGTKYFDVTTAYCSRKVFSEVACDQVTSLKLLCKYYTGKN